MQYLVDYLQNESNNNNSDEDSHEVKDLVLFHLRLVSHHHPPPPEGHNSNSALEILREFFARSDKTLTKVKLWECDFGTGQDASQLLAAFQTNRTVRDLEISEPVNLGGDVLGNCLSNLLENNTCLERLSCSLYYVADEISYNSDTHILLDVRSLQRGLRANRTLKKLILVGCHIQNVRMHLIADALEGNSTMEEIDVSYNHIEPSGLRAIARLMESTHIKTISFSGNVHAFDDDGNDDTQHFCRVLSRSMFVKCLDAANGRVTASAAAMIFQALHDNNVLEHLRLPQIFRNHRQQGIEHLAESIPRMKSLKRLELSSQDFEYGCLPQHAAILPALRLSTSIEELSGIGGRIIERSPVDLRIINNNDQYSAERAEILNITARNRALNRANLLLQPHPRTGAIFRLQSGVWQKAVAKLARNDNSSSSSNNSSSARNSGASAIFHLLQKRPGLLEPRLSPPGAESPLSPASSPSPWSPATTSTTPPPYSPVDTGYYTSGNNDDSLPAASAAASASARLSGGHKREHNIDNNNNNRSLDTGYYASGNNDDSPPSAARLNSGRKREHVQDNDDNNNNNKPFGGRKWKRPPW